MSHPITTELQRQHAQGFLESKVGIIFPDYSFKVTIDTGRKLQKIEIERKNICYRNDSDSFRVTLDGRNLLQCPNGQYAPFRYFMNHLTSIIGTEGVGKVATIDKGYEDTWHWRKTKELPCKDAIEKFRYGAFEYETKKAELTFLPDHEPEKPIGEIIVTFSIPSAKDIPFSDIDAVARYFETMK